MDIHHPGLISDCLISVFTFLKEDDLIVASCVCKDWHEAAETPWLWRRLCLQRWSFCNFAVTGTEDVNHSWKRYFLRRAHLEMKMSKGRSGSYTCKSLRGHTGEAHRGSVVGLVYLQGSSGHLPHLWNTSAIVCSASTDGTVRAWNVQNGELLWCSPVQSPLMQLITDEKHEVVITADSGGLIKTWQGETGQEMGSFPTASSHCSLLQYNISNTWFLTVGTGQGSVCTLEESALTKKSSIMVCDSFKVNMLLISPDKRWIAAGTTDHSDLSPKVIYTESLTSPAEDEDPLCQSVPVTGLQAAVFIPTQPSRVAVVHNKRPNKKILSVFDVSIKKSKYKSEIQVQQVESFTLNTSSSQILLEAKNSNCLLLAANQELLVYSLKGALLASFKEHTMPISSMCVDSFRVVTASRDLSLRVLTWRNDGGTLESRYHLLGGSHTMARGFTHVACDYSSIVASTEGKDGKDVLKAYYFTS
ncbi:F-box/WD repeat-containing protein 12 isoform X1 [Takifugu flavidus]|uniref:F-box/WD repeat-containing protein 12 isoform X1 n=1 Tax=Takifugu flavidus TaxID=433684 RepID=UPI0025445227|nr:F-box/WD repeat-containing protein 12 isoform X1 [Takifugu flavidus]